jgi:hypothetical protein
MSTKTTFKRIALVAVASLGFGLISVAPSSAAVSANPTVTFAVTGGQLVVTATHNGTAADTDTEMYLSVLSSSDTDLAVGLNLNITVAGLVTVANPSATTKTWTFATNVSPTAGPYQFRAFMDVVADGTFVAADDTFRAVGTYTPATSAAAEASIKGTATALTASAVTLTTIEPSNRVGVAVVVTPAATFANASGNATTLDSHKATMGYVLTKPAGSAAALGATSSVILSGAAIADAASATRSGTDITFTPDIAGTYSVTIWHESVADGALSTSEATATRSFVIGANELKMAISTNGSLVKGADDAGSLLVKIALTGADGKAASLAANESIVVTRTAGTAAIDFVTNDGTFAAGFGNGSAADTAASTYTFNAAQFSSAGVAAFLVNDDTAEGLSTWTINGAGGSAAALSYSMTTTASKTTAAAATNGAGTISNTTGVAGTLTNGGGATTNATIAYGKATTVAFTYTKTLAADIARIDVVDTNGNITGIAGAKYAITAGSSSSLVTTGTFSVPMTLTLSSALALANATVTIGTAVYSITAAYPVVTTVTNPELQIRSVIADTNTIRVLVKDQFGIAFNLASITPVVTGRNVTLPAQPTLWTNANGYAYYTLKDVSTSTTSLVDTVNFTSAAVQGASGTTAITSTAATVITYVTTLNVGTVTLTTPNSAEVTAGTALTPIDINAGSTGAQAGAVTVSAKVVDSNSSILTGVKVTWSIVGTSGGAAVTSTTVSGYTDATGVATAKVYGWIAGDATVTATVGGVAKAGALLFAQNDPTEVRTAVTTVDGRIVTVVAKDRFGNVVKNVPFTATALGNGFWGTGTNVIAGATTDATGTVKFLMLQALTDQDVKVEFGATAGLTTPYGQSGFIAGSFVALGTQFTAPTAGTIEDDETGVGNTLALIPAGTGAMSAKVVADTATQDAATAATDAAAEATDAANAATDAANAAAEAADAATAAAQDAADAVAALSTQVSEMVNALKKQITALTNLVIKIQKKVKA